MKKLPVLVVALIVLLSTAALADPIRIGIVNSPPTESAYYEANVQDFEDVFSAEYGYETVTAYVPENEEQQEAARRFVADGVKYLLISAVASDGWEPVLQEARDAGVTVFLFSRMIDCDPDLYAAAIVSDFAAEGETAVAWLRYFGPDELNVVHLQGTPGDTVQLGRSEALNNAFADGAMNRVAQESASWSEEEAQKIVTSVISSDRKFNVIYAESDPMAKGAAAALDEAGITHGADGDVMIVSFDCSAWALREVAAGRWNYEGQRSPFQASILQFCIQALEAGEDLSTGFGLDERKRMVSQESGFTAGDVTEDTVLTFGLGE